MVLERNKDVASVFQLQLLEFSLNNALPLTSSPDPPASIHPTTSHSSPTSTILDLAHSLILLTHLPSRDPSMIRSKRTMHRLISTTINKTSDTVGHERKVARGVGQELEEVYETCTLHNLHREVLYTTRWQPSEIDGNQARWIVCHA